MLTTANGRLAELALQSGRLRPPGSFASQVVVTDTADDGTAFGLLAEAGGLGVRVDGPAPVCSYVFFDGPHGVATGLEGVEACGPRFNRLDAWNTLLHGPMTVQRLQLSPALADELD